LFFQDTPEKIEQRRVRDIRKLQSRCKHGQISGWMEEADPRGFGSTGWELRVCGDCNLNVHIRTACSTCDELITDGEIILGEKLIGSRPLAYCKNCSSSGINRTDFALKAYLKQVRCKHETVLPWNEGRMLKEIELRKFDIEEHDETRICAECRALIHLRVRCSACCSNTITYHVDDILNRGIEIQHTHCSECLESA